MSARTEQLTAALSRTPAPARKRRPLSTYKPSGKVSWPVILVEGGEGVGKSHMMAEFTADERVGRSFWFQLGETSAHEFGGVGDYEVVEIDGTWTDLIDQVLNVVEVAEKAAANGEPPIVVCVDSVSAVWDMCAGWAYAKASRGPANKKILEGDAEGDINIGPLIWANARERWLQFYRPLQMAPLIAVLSAKAAETVAISAGGTPLKNQTAYKIRAQKELPYDVNAIVRLSQDTAPTVTKCRSPKWGVRPGVDDPATIRDLSLGRLIFDGMGFDPGNTQVSDQVELETSPKEAELPPEVAANVAALAAETGGSENPMPNSSEPPAEVSV
jgi:hypothetical protein